jgi:hypothetical protein
MSASPNRPDIRYLRPFNYPWAFGTLHTVFDVIMAKPKVNNNLLIATILIFPAMVYWSRNNFGALGNLSNALDIGSSLLCRAFAIGFVQDPSNVPL